MKHTDNAHSPGVPRLSAYAIYGLVFLVSLILYVVMQHNGIFNDCDSPWHIATGDHIRKFGHVPKTDPWSFTSGDTRWFNIAWAYDVWISWWHEKSGIRGLVAINIILTALIPCILAKICLMRGSSYLATLMTCLFFYVILSGGVAVMRPQQMSLILAAMALLSLTAYRQKVNLFIWIIPVLAMLWANIHGSFLVIFTMIGAFFLEAFFKRDWARVKIYMLVGIVSGLAILINPVGYEILYGSWRSMGSVAKGFIEEWQSAFQAKSFYVFANIFIVFALWAMTRKRLPLSDVILVLVWMGLSLYSVRYSRFFTLLTVPVIAILLTSAFSQIDGLFAELNRKLTALFARRKIAISTIAVSGLAGLFLLLPISRNMVISDNLYNPSKFPVAEIDYLIENHPDQRVYNYYDYGGYIIYQSRGTVQHFIDGRVDTAFPKDVVHEFLEIYEFPKGWPDRLAEHDIHLILFPNENAAQLGAIEAAGWNKVFKGEVATIYARPDS